MPPICGWEGGEKSPKPHPFSPLTVSLRKCFGGSFLPNWRCPRRLSYIGLLCKGWLGLWTLGRLLSLFCWLRWLLLKCNCLLINSSCNIQLDFSGAVVIKDIGISSIKPYTGALISSTWVSRVMSALILTNTMSLYLRMVLEHMTEVMQHISI